MTVDELRDYLTKLADEGHGDAPVYICGASENPVLVKQYIGNILLIKQYNGVRFVTLETE